MSPANTFVEILHWESSPDPAMELEPPLSPFFDVHFTAGKAGLQQKLLLLGREEEKLGWTYLRKAFLAGLGGAQKKSVFSRFGRCSKLSPTPDLVFPTASVPGARGVSMCTLAQHLALTRVALGELAGLCCLVQGKSLPRFLQPISLGRV